MCTLGGDANPADRTFLRPAGDVVGFAVELDQLDVEFRADGVHGVFAVGEHRVGDDRTRVFGHEHRMPRAAATRCGGRADEAMVAGGGRIGWSCLWVVATERNSA